MQPPPPKQANFAMNRELEEKRTRAVIAAVKLPDVSEAEADSSVTELRQLAKTLGFEVVGTFVQQRTGFDPTAYLGAGKRQELRRFVRNESEPEPHSETQSVSEVEAAEEPADMDARRADIVLVDHEISPTQARNLEKEIGCEVMDRTMVILEIFHRHARSRAARAQVEMVRLAYMAPRLREAAKLAGPQGRQRSGVGGRGAGEARGEMDRRKIRDRIAELQETLVAIEAERSTQRERRQERQGPARAALVGYTNAGKSTLMRALTGSDVLVADKLFATLDTTVRVLQPVSIPRVHISDTVGFIKNLPHGLVASFKSTLDEALDASLLLHVVDASDPGFERQLQVTEQVLDEIGAHGVPRILVFNKIDRLGDEAAEKAQEAALRGKYGECVVVSARRAADIATLHAAIVAFFQRRLVETELFVPWTGQHLRGKIFADCQVVEERAESAGALFRVRCEPEVASRLREQLLQLDRPVENR
jgi:GTPase